MSRRRSAAHGFGHCVSSEAGPRRARRAVRRRGCGRQRNEPAQQRCCLLRAQWRRGAPRVARVHMRASGVGLDLVAKVVSPQKLAGMVSGQRCRHRQRVPPLAQRACAGCAAATVGAVRAGAVRPGSKRASVRVRARAWQERGAARRGAARATRGQTPRERRAGAGLRTQGPASRLPHLSRLIRLAASRSPFACGAYGARRISGAEEAARHKSS